MQYLVAALKDAAQRLAPEEDKTYYLEDNPDYGQDVTRVTNVECLDCWLGFIYTKNDSKYKMTETMRPSLEGLEVMYPEMDENETDIMMSIPAGEDHIVILRRTDSSCKYGLQYMTH